MSCNFPALTILVIDASGPGVPPFERADIVLSFVFFKPLFSQYQSAIDSLAALLFRSGSP